jgi:hypothetical protein
VLKIQKEETSVETQQPSTLLSSSLHDTAWAVTMNSSALPSGLFFSSTTLQQLPPYTQFFLKSASPTQQSSFTQEAVFILLVQEPQLSLQAPFPASPSPSNTCNPTLSHTSLFLPHRTELANCGGCRTSAYLFCPGHFSTWPPHYSLLILEDQDHH